MSNIVEAVTRDLRHALRRLARNAGFTATAVLTLALGIGGTTAIFSVVHGVLLRPLPYPQPEEVMQVRHVDASGHSQLNVSFPNYADLRDANQSFAAMGAYSAWSRTVAAGDGVARIDAADVSDGFFEVLGVEPVLGRRFLPDETGAAVAVVSYGYWQNRLGGDPDLSAQVLRLGERTYQVIGVMPPGFSFPAGVQLWFPSDATVANQSRTAHNFNVIGRLQDGRTLQEARSDLSAIASRLAERYGEDTWMADAAVIPLRQELVGGVRPALLLLLGASAFLLLIGCANVVNLLLARMAAARRDLAVRAALGAGRGHLASQMLAEVFVLCLGGGALGVLLATWAVPALLALQEGSLPRAGEVSVSWAVLGFALAVSVLAALAIGILAALRSGRDDIRSSLVDGQRTQSGGPSGQGLRRALAVSQVALTLVLLVGAALLGQSFVRLASVDPGYRTDASAVVMDLWLPIAEGEAAAARVGQFQAGLLERLRGLPGVEAAGGVSAFPLPGGGANGMFTILQTPDEVGTARSFEELQQHPEQLERLLALMKNPERTGYAEFRIASDGYFGAMGIPLLRGRLFDERDAPNAGHVALISRSLAENRWPGEDPIGKLIEYGNMDGDLRPFRIVGIVGDVREGSLDAEPEPTFYGYSVQRPGDTFRFHVVMRGSAAPAAMIASAREIAHELNPDAAVEFRTLGQAFASALSDRQFTLVLMAVFGGTALLLALLGIYGVIAYLASQRAREVGVRMALGARAADVLRLFVRQCAALALAGIACGLLAAIGLTRFLAGMLYEVSTLEPVTFAAVALLLAGMAVLASYLPARRASRLDPNVTLRSE